jgi:endonuclease YncB( thermonuclease family)
MGINCPEIKTKDSEEKKLGLAARDRLRVLIADQVVLLQCYGWDKYGRLLVEIQHGPYNINAQLLAEGYAKPYLVTN